MGTSVSPCSVSSGRPQVDRAWFQRLIRKCDTSAPRSNFAYNFFDLRRYEEASVSEMLPLALALADEGTAEAWLEAASGQGLTLVHLLAQRKHFLWDRGGI